MSPTRKKQQRPNPLYVVTKKGSVVEEASGMLDALVKKLGLEPAVDLFNYFLNLLLESINSYAMVAAIRAIVDEIVEALEKITRKIDPVLAFSIFQR